MSIIRGAAIGITFGFIGAEWISPWVGERLSGVGSFIAEHKPTSLPGIGQLRSFIDAGKYSPKIEIPDNAQDWIKNANNPDGAYAKSIQGEVGKFYKGTIDQAVEQLLNQHGKTPSDLSQSSLEGMRNHLLHMMEVEGNKTFDSRLQDWVSRNVSLEVMKAEADKAYLDWLNGSGPHDLVSGGQEFISVHDQLNNLGPDQPKVLVNYVGDQPIVNYDELAKYIQTTAPENLGAIIAINFDTLHAGWMHAHPDLPFPVHLGEITYLVKLAESGDASALERLKGAFAGRTMGGERLLSWVNEATRQKILGLVGRLY